NGTETEPQFRDRLRSEYPDADWRVRGLNQAAQGVEGFLDNVTLFLTLIGMTALLTGGMGVANAVSAYLAGRRTTIAVLKCFGAPASLIFSIYLIQVGMISAIGIGAGLVLGAVAAPLALTVVGDLLPVTAAAGVYARPLMVAAIFGVLIATVFALWPLA